MTEFLRSLAEISAAMAAVIAALLLLKPLVNRRYTARWRYWVWLAVAARLLLPFNLSLAAAPVHLAAPMEQTVALPARVWAGKSSGTAAGSAASAAQNGAQTGPASGEAAVSNSTGEAAAAPSGTDGQSLTLAGLLFRIYLAGGAFFLLWQLMSRRRFSRYARRWSVPPSPEQRAVFEAEKRSLHVKMPVGLAVCPGVGGPMLTGLVHPVILLPGEVSHLSLVLRHELTHLKRRDLWYKLLLLGANAVHWFNPLVWLMVRAASRDLELVCDDATVADLDEAGHGAYGDAILSSLKSGRASPLSTGFRGGAKAVAERLRNLASGSKKQGRAALTAAVLVVALAAGLVACGPVGGSDGPEGRLALFQERFAAARAVAYHYAALDMEDRETFSEQDGGRRFTLCGHYRTKEELRAATAAVFTDSYAAGFYKLLDSDAFTEKDGGLYLDRYSLYDFSPWNAGDTVSFGGQTVDVFLWDTLTVTSADENTVTYSMEWYWTYPDDPAEGVFTLVKENGAWKFSKCFYDDSDSAGTESTPIPDEELGSLLAAEYEGPQEGDGWRLLQSRPGDGCTLGVLQYASASHAGGLGNLIFGVYDNGTKKPKQPAIIVYGDQSDCGLWWEESAPGLVLLPYTIQTIYQGAQAGTAGLLSFDGKVLTQVTELPAAARRAGVTLPEGAENMLDPSKNGNFWQSHKAVLSCSAMFELFSTNPDWEAARPEEGVCQWVFEGCVPLHSGCPDVRIVEAARRYFEEAFLPAGPYPMSSSDYPIEAFAQVTDYTDSAYPGALAYNVDLYDEDQGYLERLFLFDDDLTLLGVRSNLDYSLQFNSVLYRLGEEKTGLFGTPTATNRTVLSDGTILYSEWFGDDFSTGCDYTYHPDTGTYSLCNLVTSRLNVSTNRGIRAAIHIGSTLAELIEAYPEADTQFTPQTSCLTMFEPILGGSGCRIEFYFNPNGGLPESREDTLKRTVTRICIAAPEW